MLSASQLCARVPDERTLFAGLDLEVSPRAVTAVVGPNGSGKTTLLRCLVGLRPPEEGMVELDGRPLLAVDRRERARRIAYLPQRTTLYHDLPVREVVMIGRAPHLSTFAAPGAGDERRCAEALERVEAQDLGNRRMSTLSGGEYQRVMLARMLATDAPVLVLDEPTTALDIGHALALLELCRALAADGHAIVLALHDLELARRYTDRALCLGDDDGAHRVGSTPDVLSAEVIARVFGVEARLGDGGLVLSYPSKSPSA